MGWVVMVETCYKKGPVFSTPTGGAASMDEATLDRLEYVALAHRRLAWKDLLGQAEGPASAPTCYTLLWRLRLDDIPPDSLRSLESTAQLQRRAYRHLRTRFAPAWQKPLPHANTEEVHPLQEMVGGGFLPQTPRPRIEEIKATQDLIALDLRRLSEPVPDGHVAALQRLLTIWSLTKSDLGYRQGMHEIAFFLWSIRERESQPHRVEPPKETNTDWVDFHTLLDPSEVEADTYFLFSSIMQRLASQFFVERAGSPTLIKAILYRVDRILGCHLFDLQLEWSPILLYVGKAHLAAAGIVLFIFMRWAQYTNPVFR